MRNRKLLVHLGLLLVLLFGIVGTVGAEGSTDAARPTRTPPATRTPKPIGTPAPSAANCDNTAVGLTPLTDLGKGTYQGHEGGLYPGGSNTVPADYLQRGLAMAREVRPRDGSGQPSPQGKIAVLSIGMSNTSQESTAFQRLVAEDPKVNPALVAVNGAQGGMTAADILDPNDGGTGTKYWDTVDARLTGAGVTRAQVQTVWLKQADRSPTGSDIEYAQTLASELRTIIRILRERYPNLKLIFLSSRIYAGYASTGLNPEPYAYASGFAVKWAVEAEIAAASAADTRSAWVAWGPYLWADGLTPRSDGLTWQCSDLQNDGTHPSTVGANKVARMLVGFLKSSPTTRHWFARP